MQASMNFRARGYQALEFTLGMAEVNVKEATELNRRNRVRRNRSFLSRNRVSAKFGSSHTKARAERDGVTMMYTEK